jgi:hypothetical protein
VPGDKQQRPSRTVGLRRVVRQKWGLFQMRRTERYWRRYFEKNPGYTDRDRAENRYP